MPKLLDRALRSPTQRALFVLGCACLAPWASLKVLTASDHCSFGNNCAKWFAGSPVAAWHLADWAQYEWVEWWDRPALPGLLLIVIALSWSFTGRRVLEWIRA